MFILKFASISQNVSELPQHDTQYCTSNTTRSTVQATRHAVLCKQHDTQYCASNTLVLCLTYFVITPNNIN